jgi:C2 domain
MAEDDLKSAIEASLALAEQQRKEQEQYLRILEESKRNNELHHHHVQYTAYSPVVESSAGVPPPNDVIADTEDAMRRAIELSLASQTQEWQCKYCTFISQTSSKHCSMCNAPREDTDYNLPELQSDSEAAQHYSQARAAMIGTSDDPLIVPGVNGTLNATVIEATDLPPPSGSSLDPYVEVRVLPRSFVGRLRIMVHAATQLRTVQRIGTQDPYVQVELGRHTSKTVVHEDGGRQALWEEELAFELEGEERMATFHVMNSNVLSDSRIGQVSVSLAQLVRSAGRPKVWYKLRTESSTASAIAGLLCLTVMPHPLPKRGSAVVQAKKQCRVAKNSGTAPVWNDTASFRHLHSDLALHFCVFDRNRFKADTLIGQTSILWLDQLLLHSYFEDRDATSATWFFLQSASGEQCGKLRVSLKFESKELVAGILAPIRQSQLASASEIPSELKEYSNQLSAGMVHAGMHIEAVEAPKRQEQHGDSATAVAVAAVSAVAAAAAPPPPPHHHHHHPHHHQARLGHPPVNQLHDRAAHHYAYPRPSPPPGYRDNTAAAGNYHDGPTNHHAYPYNHSGPVPQNHYPVPSNEPPAYLSQTQNNAEPTAYSAYAPYKP